MKKLTPEQYWVTQQEGTERPFHNAYWNNKDHGIYVDIVSGEPLFSSLDKFDSGTGWPSFSASLSERNIQKKQDNKLGETRTEVRSTQGSCHLGHLFNDGPTTSAERFCINSAAMRFVPLKDLEKEGLGEFLAMFENIRPTAEDTPIETATFGAGSFYDVEDIYAKTKGVIETQVGYAGAELQSREEVVQIKFDPKIITYGELVDIFFRLHDPTQVGGYRSVIFFHHPEQQAMALRLLGTIEREKRFQAPLTTQVRPMEIFSLAEDRHQKYIAKNGGSSSHLLREWNWEGPDKNIKE